MKLQLDTIRKTIKVEGTINLEELFETLRKFFPLEEWKQFSLEANTTIEWINPITIPYYPSQPYPWWNTPVIYTSDGIIGNQIETTPSNYSLNEGVYNIQIS